MIDEILLENAEFTNENTQKMKIKKRIAYENAEFGLNRTHFNEDYHELLRQRNNYNQ